MRKAVDAETAEAKGGLTWPSRMNEVEQFLYREARYLDDREFDKWLDCYAPDAEFWMPAWDDDDNLVTDPQTRDLADLLRQPRRPGGPGLPHQDRPVQRHQPAGAAHRPQHLATSRSCRSTATSCEVRFNWFTLYYRYQTHRHLLRHVVLHARLLRAAAADQEEEGRAEERLHPPRRRHLPHLNRGTDMTFQIALNFEDGVTRFIECDAERDGGRRVLPRSGSTSRWTAATAPAAPASRSASPAATTAATTSRTR